MLCVVNTQIKLIKNYPRMRSIENRVNANLFMDLARTTVISLTTKTRRNAKKCSLSAPKMGFLCCWFVIVVVGLVSASQLV